MAGDRTPTRGWPQRREPRTIAPEDVPAAALTTALAALVDADGDPAALVEGGLHGAAELAGAEGVTVVSSRGETVRRLAVDPETAGLVREAVWPSPRRGIVRVVPAGGGALDVLAVSVPPASGGGVLAAVGADGTLDPSREPLLRHYVSFVADAVHRAANVALLRHELDVVHREGDHGELLLAAVAHDVRTPVLVIKGLTRLLIDDRDLDVAGVGDALERVERNADRIATIVDDLLEIERSRVLGRLHRGVPTDVSALVGEVLDRIEVPSTHRLRCDFEPVGAVIEPALVARTIENLVSNAVTHTPTGSTVVVRVHAASADRIRVSVDDDGPGIDLDGVERLFAPFERDTGGGPGVGLGLHVVARFAERLGGRIWVEASPLGGASFRLELPVLGPPPPDAEPLLFGAGGLIAS